MDNLNIEMPIVKKRYCEHHRRKTICKECKGSSICKHNRQKTDVKTVKGKEYVNIIV